MGELLNEATIDKKGLMSAYSYVNTQGKNIPNNADDEYYEIANIPKGSFSCIEVNGASGKNFLSVRMIANYSLSSGFSCIIVNALPPKTNLLRFYTDGKSKLYINKRTSFMGSVRVITTSMNFGLTMSRISSTEDLIEIESGGV